MAPKRDPTERGRSTSAERAARGAMTRDQVKTFVASLAKKDKIAIEWRIVDPSLPAADTNEVPCAKWTGEVKDFDEFDGSRQAVIEYLDDSYMPVGDYALPQEVIQGGYVEIKTLAKTGRVIPRLTHLAKPKRPREEETATNHLERTHANPLIDDKSMQVINNFTEAMMGQRVTLKLEVTPGLRLEDAQNEKFLPFETFHWVRKRGRRSRLHNLTPDRIPIGGL